MLFEKPAIPDSIFPSGNEYNSGSQSEAAEGIFAPPVVRLKTRAGHRQVTRTNTVRVLHNTSVELTFHKRLHKRKHKTKGTSMDAKDAAVKELHKSKVLVAGMSDAYAMRAISAQMQHMGFSMNTRQQRIDVTTKFQRTHQGAKECARRLKQLHNQVSPDHKPSTCPFCLLVSSPTAVSA